MGFTKAHRYHGMYRFIDDTNAVNENTKLYPKELELKVKHRGKHATFLDLQSWSFFYIIPNFSLTANATEHGYW